MNSFQRHLRYIAEKLLLNVQIPFVMQLPCGIVGAEALIKGFEFEFGILVISDIDQLGGVEDKLANFGYGYVSSHLFTGCEHWKVRDWEQLFRNWAWSSNMSPPLWYINST